MEGAEEFRYGSTDLIEKVKRINCDDGEEVTSEFDRVLRNLWDKKMEDGLFRYSLKRNSLPVKILPGEFNYVVQLNPERAVKRRKPMQIQSPSQSFDPDQFNFNKVEEKEILFRLKPQREEDEGKEHLLLINVSPLEYCHVLLTPSRNHNRSQRLTFEGFQLGLDLVLLSSSPNFRVGFNSLCGFASVNHEHWHAYLLDKRLYLEDAPLERLKEGVDCFEIQNHRYPPGICFVLPCQSRVGEGNELILEGMPGLKQILNYLEENQVAHNVYITRGTNPTSSEAFGVEVKEYYDCVRIFIWARTPSFGAKTCDAFNPALCELAGHFPLKNEQAYQDLTEEMILAELHAICNEPFAKMKEWITKNF